MLKLTFKMARDLFLTQDRPSKLVNYISERKLLSGNKILHGMKKIILKAQLCDSEHNVTCTRLYKVIQNWFPLRHDMMQTNTCVKMFHSDTMTYKLSF